MASNLHTQRYADGSRKLVRRSTRQGRKKQRAYIKILVRMPEEYVEMMKWKNEQCGGLNSVNDQVRQAVRAALCGCVYTQLLKQ